MIFTIDKNPENETFDALMDLAFEVCNEFHLVLRRDMGNIRALDPILDKLKGSFKEMKLESNWASTMLADGNEAEVYFYHADENAKKVIREMSNSLYEWSLSEPNVLPEDLSFFKDDTVWLVNCAHERESYINTDDAVEIDRLKNIKGLKISEYPR
jgi:hypothetical protein